ncbi:MAG: PQQ-dependent sugar dehydrogenase [Bacillota bacterium]
MAVRGRIAIAILLNLALLAGCAGGPKPGEGGEKAGWPSIRLEQMVDGLNRPISLVAAGDGSGRLYALEQPGRIRLIEGSKLVEQPFLDLTDRVLARGNEQGLLGLAFAPDYARSGLFYVHYSGQKGGETVIARYRRSAGDPRRGDPGSEEVLLTVEQPYANHNGGAIMFGPDGSLYIALGDGGSAGDPGNRAQNLDLLLGKILRIDVSQPGAYRIPPDNPFAGKAGRDEIWAYGLRNPWRISFDRETGDLWIADVGQNQIEEINFQPAASRGGENYGWKLFEGTERYSGGGSPPPVVEPVAQYTHQEGGCSVTGGYVYRGSAVPALTGIYLYADFCSGKIWGLKRAGERWESSLLLDTELAVAAFGEDEQGELYVVDRGGSIHRVRAAD